MAMRKGAEDRGVPFLYASGVADFIPDGTEGLEKEVGEIRESRGGAGRDAEGGDEGPKTREEDVEVVGGFDLAGESAKLGGDFIGSGFEKGALMEAAFSVGVEEAEKRMIWGDGHAAVAAIGKRELASCWKRRGCWFSGFFEHGRQLCARA